MNSNTLNEQIRKKTAEYFKTVVKGKYVMDFGGGTGADLRWLSENNYEVCFCEPANAMRNIAIEHNASNIKSESIEFLMDTKTDFRAWEIATFYEKFDAVLANFCVFNIIDDLQLLFSKLSMSLKPKGHIIALLLDATFTGITKHYLKNFIISFLKNSYPSLIVQYSGNRHTVYLHTPGKIKQSLPKELTCIKIESLGDSGFMLVHIQKQ
jgi:SAM-dependent methyltransferase